MAMHTPHPNPLPRGEGAFSARYVHWLLWLLLALSTTARAAGFDAVAGGDDSFDAGFNQPSSVAVDATGRMYVLDGTQDRVVVLSADGRKLAEFGGGLKRPLDLALVEDDSSYPHEDEKTPLPTSLLIADTGNRRLAWFEPDGSLRKSFPLPADPEAGAPEPVAVSVLHGMAYWADRKTHRLCRLDLATGVSSSCFGGRGETDGKFQHPYQIALDRDHYLNVVDIVNARIQVFDKSGRFFSQISRFGLSPGELFRPNGIAIDRSGDTFFVADGYFGTITVFRKGEFAGMLEDADGKPVTLDSPTGLAWRDGRLYVAETGANRIRRFAVEYRDAEKKTASAGLRVELSQKNCVLCHLSWAHEAPREVRAADAQGALPEASFRMCYSCHNGAIMDSRLVIHHGAQHPVVYESDQEKQRHAKLPPRKDKLPEQFPTTHDKQLLCTACHTPHTDSAGLAKGAKVDLSGSGHPAEPIGTLAATAQAADAKDQVKQPPEPQPEPLYADHANAWLRVPNHGGDLCERCHESRSKGAREREAAKQGQNHPLALRFAPPPFANAKGYPTNHELFKGLPKSLLAGGAALGKDQEMICQTCHQVHGGHKDGEMTVIGRDGRDGHAKGELCSVCHPRQSSKDKDDAHAKGVHPVNLERKSDDPGEKPVLWKGKPEIGEVGCETCHSVHKGTQGTTLMPEGVKSDGLLCKNCHERQHSDSAEDAHRKGVHPVNVKRDEPIEFRGEKIREVTCQTCHRVHQGSPDTALLPEGVKKAEAMCQECHDRQHAEDKDDARRKGVHPVNAKLDEPVEIGKEKVEKVGCLSCHAVHKGKPDTAALVETDRNGELCSHCHKLKQTVVGTDHDMRITAKDKKNAHDQLPRETGVCGACHTLHRGKGEMPFLSAVKKVDPRPTQGPDGEKMDETPFQRDRLCIECHRKEGLGKDKVVNHFSHPHEDLILRSDQKVLPLLGQDGKPADFGRIACITCHEPHVWDAEKKPQEKAVKIAVSGNQDNLEGSNRDSFLRRKGVDHTFCIDCHGQEGLLKYKFYHDEKRSRNKHLDYLK